MQNWTPKDICMQTALEEAEAYLLSNKKYPLSTLDFRRAVISSHKEDALSKEVVKATVHIPLWVRKNVSIKNIETGVSQGKIFTGMINHGTALLKDQYTNSIEDVEQIRLSLLGSNNSIIISLIQDFSVSVNGINGGGRRSVYVPVWCKDFLGYMGGVLRMDFSSLIRLSMYMSLNTCTTLVNNDHDICANELHHFEKILSDFVDICDRLSDKEIVE